MLLDELLLDTIQGFSPCHCPVCQTAYGHYADYMRVAVAGGDRAAADRSLAAYDKAASERHWERILALFRRLLR